MPKKYKKSGNQSTPVIPMGGSSTPKSVMGGEGKSVQSTVTKNAWHFQNRPTGNTPFPGGMKSKNAAKSKQNG